MSATKRAAFSPKKWCAAGCGTAILQHEFMCKKHWFKIPAELRKRILKMLKERNFPELIQAHNEAKMAVAALGK